MSKLLTDYGSKKNLDFWKEAAPGQEAEIMVSSKDLKTLRTWFQKQKISSSVVNKNIQKNIDEEKESTFTDYLGIWHNFLENISCLLNLVYK